jgi:subtilisin-like proprotein convertase family protein
MKKLFKLMCVCALLGLTAVPAAQADSLARDTYHNDHRTAPKLQFEPQWDMPGGLTGPGTADAFIEQAGHRYGLPADRQDLRLLEARESLLGTHYIYQQELNGIPVEGGQFTVSVAHRDGRVYRVYNNIYPVELRPAAPAAISSEQALDIAWQYLRANGDLLAPALSKLVYMPVGDTFVLQHIIDLELSAPYGGWRLTVDAEDGVVTGVEDPRLIRKINPDTPTIAERLATHEGQAGDRQAAFARYEAIRHEHEPHLERGDRAQGTGVVFDPDPRTTLQNNSVQDSSPSSTFTPAYFTRDLLDLTYSGGIYRLTGPWVYIANWDPPSTQPSTTTSGNWTATRGNNAFNDAMTYFHLDQNQRYMQSLGFTGATGIQNGSILADTDGVSGADNSYYQPAYNRLSFGHGCVDDNEDADVILHEYGHAIQHDITYWAGGDTGAMGEGFGDYWAGSYSISTLHGDTFYPNWVYTWDGHGSPTLCWPGRIMNATGATYVHTTTYGAHSYIPGGYVSDELWSTPLFQTLLTLVDMGYPREDVDQIILESHFGIGVGPKMRDMANATIAVAQMLQPGGPHADVFVEKFLVHSIVEIPVVQLTAGAASLAGPAGANGVADPGETFDVNLEVMNVGNLAAGGVSAVLTSANPLVQVVAGTSTYNDLSIGGSGLNATPFTVALDETFPCGDQFELTLTLSYNNDRASTSLDYAMGTGTPQGMSESAEPNLAIPDANTSGITSSLTVSGTGATVTASFTVDMHIVHPNIGDLRVVLNTPGGNTLWLHNRTGGSEDNLIGTYPTTLTPLSSFDQIIGQPLDGDWTLHVIDWNSGNTGTLVSWGVNEVSGYECEDVASPVEDQLLPEAFAVWQNHPNPFNPMTTISFAVPENAGPVTLAVYDISGRLVRTLESGSLAAGQYSRVWDGRDASGRSVSSGTYFYRLSGRGFSEARKMVLMK